MFVPGLFLVLAILNNVNLRAGSAPRPDQERISDADIDMMEQDLEKELSLESQTGTVYLNEWAAEIPGGQQVADVIAKDLGYRNMGQVGDPMISIQYHDQDRIPYHD